MNSLIKMKDFAEFTLTRESGNRVYEKIKQFLNTISYHDNLIIDFQNINDVSVSFIQATVFRLANDYSSIELKNTNPAIQFKIKTLLKITTIDPAILRKVVNLPIKSL
ncbi:MAG: DUF4325 domain-containing protein [Syntrophaceae bacterium]|nr:DUF4325 domain-containing protein [Syntrophaceae bacterium]